MRQYISQEEMEATLERLNAKMDRETHDEEVARIKRAKGSGMPLGYRPYDVRYRLWSNGRGDGTFRNTHRCWPLSRMAG